MQSAAVAGIAGARAPRRGFAEARSVATYSRSLVIGATAVVTLCAGSPGASDPFAAYVPTGFLDPATRTRIDGGAAIVDVLPARDRNLAVFGAARVRADSHRLVRWTRRIDLLQQGRYMPAAGRFSNPPRLEDLEGLALGEADLEDLRRCRPGDCGVKLSADEIEQLQRTIAGSGPDWRKAVQAQFRRMMLERARTYLHDGYDRTAPYLDRRAPVPPGLEFMTVAAVTREGSLQEPRLLDYLEDFPHREENGVESFLYWSTEALGTGKPIVSITHIAIVRGMDDRYPEALVASKQVFATHYLSASLSLTGITRPSSNGSQYLLYTRHSRVDLFRGAWAGMVRRIVEGRIRSDGPAALDILRRRLEAGEPPVQ